jgi:hypothetical protein
MIKAVLIAVISLSALSAQSDETTTTSNKLSLRLSNGILTNAGTLGGSSLAIAGVDLGFAYFADPKMSFGASYRADFDYSKMNVPIHGADVFLRYYFHNQGTRVKTIYPGSVSERHDRFALYAGPSLSQRTFFIGTTSGLAAGQEATGNYMSLNGAVGLNYGLGGNYELTAEGSYGVLSFAASDPRVRIKGMLFVFGLNFLL